MKCKDCGQYEALSWSQLGLCLRCWFKPAHDYDAPPAGEQLEIVEQPDEYDRCAHCNRKFLARTSADNFYCDDCYKTQEYLEEDPDYSDPDIEEI